MGFLRLFLMIKVILKTEVGALLSIEYLNTTAVNQQCVNMCNALLKGKHADPMLQRSEHHVTLL